MVKSRGLGYAAIDKIYAARYRIEETIIASKRKDVDRLVLTRCVSLHVRRLSIARTHLPPASTYQ